MTTINELKQAAEAAARERARTYAESRELHAAAEQLRRRVAEAERTPLIRHVGLADDKVQLLQLEVAYAESRAALDRAELGAQLAAQRLSQAEMEADQAQRYLARLQACRDDDLDVVLLPIVRWREA